MAGKTPSRQMPKDMRLKANMPKVKVMPKRKGMGSK